MVTVGNTVTCHKSKNKDLEAAAHGQKMSSKEPTELHLGQILYCFERKFYFTIFDHKMSLLKVAIKHLFLFNCF